MIPSETHQRDVRAAYAEGRKMGDFEARLDTGWKLPAGVAIGVFIGTLIPVVVIWVKGVCP